MKTIKFIGMALFAILMCVNFTSCSQNDDPTKNDNGTIIKGKRLTKLTCDDSYEFESYIFNYDDKGKLIEVIETKEGAPYCYYSFTWNDDFVQAIAIYTNSSNNSYTFSLNIKDGLVKNALEERRSQNFGDTLVYNNSNKLIRNQWNDGTTTFIWDGDKLVSYSIKHYSSIGKGFDVDAILSYNKTSCKKSCFHPILLSESEYLLIDYYFERIFAFAYPELVGLSTTLLPTKVDYGHCSLDYKYEFDKDGYVSKIIIPHANWDVTYTLTWE